MDHFRCYNDHKNDLKIAFVLDLSGEQRGHTQRPPVQPARHPRLQHQAQVRGRLLQYALPTGQYIRLLPFLLISTVVIRPILSSILQSRNPFTSSREQLVNIFNEVNRKWEGGEKRRLEDRALRRKGNKKYFEIYTL